jgi:hypothetical protein
MLSMAYMYHKEDGGRRGAELAERSEYGSGVFMTEYYYYKYCL